MQYRLGLPSWKERLDGAVKKFKTAGASSEDIAGALKNHPFSEPKKEFWAAKSGQGSDSNGASCEISEGGSSSQADRLTPQLHADASPAYDSGETGERPAVKEVEQQVLTSDETTISGEAVSVLAAGRLD